MLYAKLTRDAEAHFPSHVHNHYEVMFVRSGEGYLYSGDKKFPMTPGAIFIAPPHIEHGIVSNEGHKIISIGGNFDRLFFMDGIYAMMDNEYKEGGMLAEAILRNVYGNEEYAQSLCKAYIRYILLNIDIPQNIYSVIHRITSHIENNFDDPDIDVTELLRESGYAEDYIRAKFLLVTKTTPVKYLTAIRMKNAKMMLNIYDFSVGDIAQRCGILDVAYFSRIFKKYYGVSPKQYRDTIS